MLAPRVWARLNVHVVMKLRSKYAVTLYEVLEAYVNRETKVCTASLNDVRAWLKVPDEAYQSWKDFRRNVVDIAVGEINEHGDEAGFTVVYEGLREGKAFTKIKFTVSKTDGRTARERIIQRKAKIHKRRARAIATTSVTTTIRPTIERTRRSRLDRGRGASALAIAHLAHTNDRGKVMRVGSDPQKEKHGP